MIVMEGPLTWGETTRLRQLEGVVRKGLKTFKDVGEALEEIRDKRLHRTQHPTFESYCRSRFDFGAGQAGRYIAAAGASREVSAAGLPAPKRIGQAEALLKMPRDMRPAAWEASLAARGGEQPTATSLDSLAARLRSGMTGSSLARLVADEEREARRRQAEADGREKVRGKEHCERKAKDALAYAERMCERAGWFAAAALVRDALAAASTPAEAAAA